MDEMIKTPPLDLMFELEVIEELEKIVAPSIVLHQPPDPC